MVFLHSYNILYVQGLPQFRPIKMTFVESAQNLTEEILGWAQSIANNANTVTVIHSVIHMVSGVLSHECLTFGFQE